MIVGAKHLTWAPVTSGGDGGAMVYGSGTMEVDKVVRVDMSEERGDVAFYADDKRIDRDNSVSGASVAIEVAQLTPEMREGILGHVKASTDYSVTEDASPFVGVGFCLKQRYKGAATFRAYWYYKVQFSEGQRSFNTRGENLEFQTESLEGEAEGVQLTEAGTIAYYVYSEHATEAAAITWLKSKANVS